MSLLLLNFGTSIEVSLEMPTIEPGAIVREPEVCHLALGPPALALLSLIEHAPVKQQMPAPCSTITIRSVLGLVSQRQLRLFDYKS